MRREEIEYCKARAGKASATLEDELRHGMRKRRICAISAISANDGVLSFGQQVDTVLDHSTQSSSNAPD